MYTNIQYCTMETFNNKPARQIQCTEKDDENNAILVSSREASKKYFSVELRKIAKG